MSLPRIAIIDGKFRPQYYVQVRDAYPAHWVNLDDPSTGDVDLSSFDLALISDEFYSPGSLLLLEAQRKGVPVLHVVDGVLEWRNTWENPRSLAEERGLPLFQPVLADKIACLGRSQARILESWGNLGRCEVVGAPRLDNLLERRPRQRATSEPWTVLVMTARTPGFTAAQMAAATRSLADLRNWFAANREIDGTPTRCLWRVTMQLDEELGLDRRDCCLDRPLAEVLPEVDAVITTPSTAMLEAMLQGVPVALLDYNNCPHFTVAPWTITSPAHIQQTLGELFCPPGPKLVWQDTLLHDQLECRGPATQRLIQLIEEMVRAGREARRASTALKLPHRILADPQAGHHMPEASFDLAALYPAHRILQERTVAVLQAHVGHLQLQLQAERKKTEDVAQTVAQIRKVFGVKVLLRAARKLPRLIGRPTGPRLY